MSSAVWSYEFPPASHSRAKFARILLTRMLTKRLMEHIRDECNYWLHFVSKPQIAVVEGEIVKLMNDSFAPFEGKLVDCVKRFNVLIEQVQPAFEYSRIHRINLKLE
jgi:hypothetical protein